MADKRKAPHARRVVVAAGTLLLSAALFGPPASAASSRIVVVTAEPSSSSIPFGPRTVFGSSVRNQMQAQTFVAPEPGVKLVAISTYLAGTDATAVVEVVRVGAEPPLGTTLATVEDHVDADWGTGEAGWHRLRIKPPVVMEAGQVYSFVLSSKDGAYRMATPGSTGYEGGERYCFCPTILDDEDADFENYSWQTAESLNGWAATEDLAFKLRFRRPRGPAPIS
jgi:hypothetical protein